MYIHMLCRKLGRKEEEQKRKVKNSGISQHYARQRQRRNKSISKLQVIKTTRMLAKYTSYHTKNLEKILNRAYKKAWLIQLRGYIYVPAFL